MDSNSKRLGAFLGSARKKVKLTLREVEDETGISNAYLSQIENGRVDSPSPKILHKLSTLYNIDYETLLECAGYPLPDRTASNRPKSSFLSRLGPTSIDEEKALLEYLDFLRSRKGR